MKNSLYILGFVFIFLGCSKESSQPILPQNPSRANLIFPFENSLCNVGTDVTAAESTVLFEWEAAEGTDRYEVRLTDLLTGIESDYSTENTEILIRLKRGNPYEWLVISLSNSVSETAQSNIWRFYNAAEGIQAYAPFAAEIISPEMAEIITTTTNLVTLDWIGNDVDDDITGYDVYFGISDSPEILQMDLEESIISNVPVVPNTIYFWKVITKDSSGNKSDSGLFQFKIL